MLKRFFVSMLGTIAGLWISIILFIVISIMCIGVLAAKLMGDSPTPSFKDGVMRIELSGMIEEYDNTQSLIDIIAETENQSLAQITTAIRMAANDKKIKGIYIDCMGAEMGSASRQEILEALLAFKESGKWVYAYGDSYAQGDYYIASAADKVMLNPQGMVEVKGVASATIFFKNLLDKVGVDMQVIRVGQFKSAVEPFMRTDMSEASELQTRVFVGQIWDNMRGEISKNRGVDPATVDMWADSLSTTWTAKKCLNQKMVTELAYRSQAEQALRDKLGLKIGDDLPFISPADYLSGKASKLTTSAKDHFAVLYAVGDIVDTGDEGISAENMVPAIYDLANDDKVKGLILRVNSGGGSAFASEQIWHALEEFKAKGKPFYVSMGDYAASGGYYISCGADKIYADATTLTGSIGIFGLIPNAEKLLTDKLGINVQIVETNDGANFPTIYKAMDERQTMAMQSLIDHGYETFVSRVAAGRDIPADSVKAIGGGRVWDGVSALNIGLVDELGNLNSAIEAMADKLGMSAKDYVSYPSLDLDLKAMFTKGMPTIEVTIQELPVDGLSPIIEAARTAKEMNPVQARMEQILIY